jgi:predicted transcriptional regulator
LRYFRFLKTSANIEEIFKDGGRKTMTVRELAMRLKEMYENSSNEKTTMIHLFGIMYAEEIKGCGSTPKEILKLANMPESYQTEISKGVRLSKYVDVKERYSNL